MKILKKEFCCLLIHGFGGSREEVAPLKSYLLKSGVDTFDVLLKGHEQGFSGLANATSKEWIKGVIKCFRELKHRYNKVYVIGFSMGGLISTYTNEFGPEAIVFINTPIYYWDIRNMSENLKDNFGQYIKKYINESINKPPQSLIQFVKVLVKTKNRNLNPIECPILIIQSKDDDTVRFKSAYYIYNKVSSKFKKIQFVDSGGHNLLNSKNSDFVCQNIYSFVMKTNSRKKYKKNIDTH